jgi:hypothetical protein
MRKNRTIASAGKLFSKLGDDGRRVFVASPIARSLANNLSTWHRCHPPKRTLALARYEAQRNLPRNETLDHMSCKNCTLRWRILNDMAACQK